MKTISMRELNQQTSRILDAVESGEAFELRRNGKPIGYLTHTPPEPNRHPDWKAHFEWLEKQRSKGGRFVRELEEDRQRLRAREEALLSSYAQVPTISCS